MCFTPQGFTWLVGKRIRNHCGVDRIHDNSPFPIQFRLKPLPTSPPNMPSHSTLRQTSYETPVKLSSFKAQQRLRSKRTERTPPDRLKKTIQFFSRTSESIVLTAIFRACLRFFFFFRSGKECQRQTFRILEPLGRT